MDVCENWGSGAAGAFDDRIDRGILGSLVGGSHNSTVAPMGAERAAGTPRPGNVGQSSVLSGSECRSLLMCGCPGSTRRGISTQRQIDCRREGQRLSRKLTSPVEGGCHPRRSNLQCSAHSEEVRLEQIGFGIRNRSATYRDAQQNCGAHHGHSRAHAPLDIRQQRPLMMSW